MWSGRGSTACDWHGVIAIIQLLSPVWLWTHGLQHARLSCPSLSPRVYSNSCRLSRWCHPTISPSVVPFSCLQYVPASGSFQVSQFFISGGQSTGVSASILSAWCLNQITSVHNTGITRDSMSNSSPGIMNPVGHHFSPLGFPKHLQTNNILLL